MADILLIHGSCHGARCWRDLIPALAARGHAARAIDLPSHGADETPAGDVTLDLYARSIVAALGDSTLLIGHSMAGYPITRAAMLAPDRISRLVYLCAYVPRPGHSLAEMRRMAPRQPLLDAIIRDPDGLTMRIDPAKAASRFYYDVSPDTADWAVRQLGPQPLLPQETAFDPGPALAHPRSYILCENDNTIPAEWQDSMVKDWPPDDVIRMASGHSPFLSDPETLAFHIDAIARKAPK